MIGESYRHNVRGSIYVKIGEGKLQLKGGRRLTDGHALFAFWRKDHEDSIYLCDPEDFHTFHTLDVFKNYGASQIAPITLQAKDAVRLASGDKFVVYRGEDNRMWARPVAEFYDGRFTKLDIGEHQ